MKVSCIARYTVPEENSVSMDPNDTEAATNSSYEAPESSCWEFYATYVTAGDVNDSIALWIIIGLVSLASPTIVLLNALVIIALRLRKELQRLSNVLLLSVAISDLLHLTLIAWERNVAIQKWIEYKTIVTRSRLNKFSIIAWMSATFMVLPDIMLLTVVNEDDRLDFAAAWTMVNAILAVCALALIVYFYIMVYLGIRKHKTSEISQVTSLISAKLEKKVAKMTALVTAVLIISFLPLINFFGCVKCPFPRPSR